MHTSSMASPPSPTVQIISDCFIKPKFTTPQTQKPTYFSPWDYAMISVNYIQKGLLFRLPKSHHFSINTFLDNLKDSLSVTLSHFHPLAGRLATGKLQINEKNEKNEKKSSFVVYIDNENSDGARFIHAGVDLTVDDILKPIDVPVTVGSFFDHDKAIDHDGHELSLLTVQVTTLNDGVFVGCSINHMVVDGSAYWHFFNSFSEVFNSKREAGVLTPVSRPPVLERWVPEGCSGLPFTSEDEYIDRPVRPVLRERIFRISAGSLGELKAKVNAACGTTKISSLQSLSAVMWRCITRARRFSRDQETGCRLAVNNRARLSPPLPENYFGNSIQTVKETTTAGELLDHDISWAALRLHQAVANHDNKAIRDYVDSWVKSPFVYKMGLYFNGNSIQMGSSPRFDMYGNEFGFGKAVAVLSGYANKFDGKVTLYPGREGGGSMDLEVCMLPENMGALELDEEFMSIVNGDKVM